MEKRRFKDTDKQISLLGMGCMRLPRISPDKADIDYKKAEEIIDYAYSHGINYFDTAYPYHEGESETFLGKVLKKYDRDSFYLATKFPIWEVKEASDVEKIFNEQLEKLGVEYFDFYLCHALNIDRFRQFQSMGILEFLDKKREEGVIRHLGFSFHDAPESLYPITEEFNFDFAQIQLNYLDWEMQNAKKQYEILKDHNLQCIIMEPVRGGMLASLCPEADAVFKDYAPDKSVASWAIRFAASLPNVLTVLSGMSNLEQIIDNVSTMTDFKPVSEEEQKVIDLALNTFKEKNTIPCTGCRYCMDCPFGVDIPKLFKLYNDYYAIVKRPKAFKDEYNKIPVSEWADKCRSCKRCMSQCPQKINIPEKLKMINDIINE